LEPTDDIPIYNTCNGSMAFVIHSKNILSYGHKTIESFPLNDMVWSAGGTISGNKYIYFIRVLLLHVLPAILLDSLLWIFGKKTMVLKIQRRIYNANCAIAYYLTQQWTFSNKNYLSLRSKIKAEDFKHFYYVMENVDILNDYIKNCVIGARRYLLKEEDDTLPKARVHYRRINILANLVKYVFYGCTILWIVRTDFVRNLYDNTTN
ncbi:jg12316, partial [Pararge aegeria aegeria]